MMGPAKVPDDLGQLIVSPKAYASQDRLFASFRWLRSNNPIGLVEAEGFDPFWAVTKHADILEVSRQNDLFHNGDRATALIPRASDEKARASTGGSPHPIRTIVHMDAPDHPKYRRITQAWFTQQNLKTLEERIRIIARSFVERMAAHGEVCDFVRDVALHYPLRVMMEILGVPEEDELLMLRFTQDLFGTENELLRRHPPKSVDPDRHAKQLFKVFANFQAYFSQLAASRRKVPRNDLISVIANAKIDGKPIQCFEATSYFVILATAGHDTAASSTSGAIWALCDNPGEFTKIKNGTGLIPNLVEEAVRWTTPVQHFMRTATANTELRDRRITKGDWLMLCYLSGNRDEEAFEYPDNFCVDRGFPRNVAFGYGAHTCLGQHLARLEMSIFFEELFARLVEIEIAGEPRRSASIFVGGPLTLPIRFKID
ncbi:MAG: cytochrome P450 [Pseudolabrys sp.]